MKRNKYIFISGIIYIIACAMLFLLAYNYLSAFLNIDMQIYESGVISDYELYDQFILTLVSMSIYKFIQGVVFLVFGILLIKKSKNFPNCKTGSITTAMILGYVFAIFEDYTYWGVSIFALLLTGAIFISIAFAKRNVVVKSTLYSTNVDSCNLEEMSEKIKSLKNLKASGIVSEEEYQKMLQSIILDKDMSNKDDVSKK